MGLLTRLFSIKTIHSIKFSLKDSLSHKLKIKIWKIYFWHSLLDEKSHISLEQNNIDIINWKVCAFGKQPNLLKDFIFDVLGIKFWEFMAWKMILLPLPRDDQLLQTEWLKL